MKSKFFEKTSTFVIAAFSLVAALAWNDAIKLLLQSYIQPGGTIISMFVYAVTVTIIAVFATIYVNKIVDRFIKTEDKLEKKIKLLEKEITKRKR